MGRAWLQVGRFAQSELGPEIGYYRRRTSWDKNFFDYETSFQVIIGNPPEGVAWVLRYDHRSSNYYRFDLTYPQVGKTAELVGTRFRHGKAEQKLYPLDSNELAEYHPFRPLDKLSVHIVAKGPRLEHTFSYYYSDFPPKREDDLDYNALSPGPPRCCSQVFAQGGRMGTVRSGAVV